MKPVEQGANAAIEFLRSTREHVDCLSPIERSQWFCGFITAVASWSKGSVGWHRTETMLLATLQIVPTVPFPDNTVPLKRQPHPDDKPDDGSSDG